MAAFSSTVRTLAMVAVLLIALIAVTFPISVNAKTCQKLGAKCFHKESCCKYDSQEIDCQRNTKGSLFKTCIFVPEQQEERKKKCQKLGAKCFHQESCCKYKTLAVECKRNTKASLFKTCIFVPAAEDSKYEIDQQPWLDPKYQIDQKPLLLEEGTN